MRRRTGGYVVAALLLGLAACTPPSAPPVNSPTPAPPSVTPTPSPTENATERQMRLDQEAAERAYLTATGEVNRLAMAGGASAPTKLLQANAGGFYLESLMNGQKVLKKNGWRTDRPGVVTVTANRGYSPTEIGLTGCEDASATRLLDRAGNEVNRKRPRLFVQSLTATKVAGRWKITDGDTKIVKSLSGEAGCST